jgi:hypothetical protein
VPVGRGGGDDGLLEATRELCVRLGESDIEASCPEAGIEEGGRGPVAALAAAGNEGDPGANIVVVARFPETRQDDRAVRTLLRDAFEANAGVVLVPDGVPRLVDGEEPHIALWLREQGPAWEPVGHLPHADLALLIAYRLTKTWGGAMTLVTALGQDGEPERAEAYLLEVAARARLPGPPELMLIDRPFASSLERAPASTRLHVFALSRQTDFEWLREIRERLDAPCIFVRDSGIENAFA